MSLHKPGKEHTINFIYCCTQILPAALPPTPKGWGNMSLGSVPGRRVWRWVTAFLDWGGNPRNGVGCSGPLFLPAAIQSRVHVARGSPQRPRTSQWEKSGPRSSLHLRLENLRPSHHLSLPARRQADRGQGHTTQSRLASKCLLSLSYLDLGL